MNKTLKIIIFVIIFIVALCIAWYFAGPLFLNKEVNEDLPESFVLPSEEEFGKMSPEEKEEMEMKMIEMFEDKGVEVEEELVINKGPTLVQSGNFRDADSFHKGSGEAKLYMNDIEGYLLRLESFMVTNGPDLHVLLSENPNPTSSDDLGKYADLGSLKGNEGNQNYDILNTIDVSKYKSVVIYCKPFHVVFSVASLN